MILKNLKYSIDKKFSEIFLFKLFFFILLYFHIIIGKYRKLHKQEIEGI